MSLVLHHIIIDILIHAIQDKKLIKMFIYFIFYS